MMPTLGRIMHSFLEAERVAQDAKIIHTGLTTASGPGVRQPGVLEAENGNTGTSVRHLSTKAMCEKHGVWGGKCVDEKLAGMMIIIVSAEDV